MIETREQINGQQLAPGETFHFSCRPGLACFNTCCRNKRLPLWPYDMLRLRRALEITSAELLEQYVVLEMDPNSGWPALRLQLDDQGRCPFLSPQGCRVYVHRPTACRIYPLARAVGSSADGLEVLFFRQTTEGCLGWDQETTHTTETWAKDQGLEPYHRANEAMHTLFFHPRRSGRLQLTPRQIHAVILALYNLDVFRAMVARPEFPMNPGGRGAGASDLDDETLLKLGRDFLIQQLFQKGAAKG